MAIALDLSEDALKRWASGAEAPKPGLHAELQELAQELKQRGLWAEPPPG